MLLAGMMPHSISVCILAGGGSRRMGRDKARLRLGEHTMLGQVKVTARALGLPVRVLKRDAIPPCGPLGGIFTGLKESQTDAVLFLACDMPFVSARLLAATLVRYRARPANPLFVAVNGVAGFPLVVPRATIGVVARQIQRQELSLQQLARALEARRLRAPKSWHSELFNVNNRTDWKQACRRLVSTV